MLLAPALPPSDGVERRCKRCGKAATNPVRTRLACADTPEVEQERAAYIHARTARYHTFLEGLQILEGALAIGRQAEDPAPQEVRTRMEGVQSPPCGSVADSPSFAKIKRWFEAKRSHGVSRVTALAPRATCASCSCLHLRQRHASIMAIGEGKHEAVILLFGRGSPGGKIRAKPESDEAAK